MILMVTMVVHVHTQTPTYSLSASFISAYLLISQLLTTFELKNNFIRIFVVTSNIELKVLTMKIDENKNFLHTG